MTFVELSVLSKGTTVTIYPYIHPGGERQCGVKCLVTMYPYIHLGGERPFEVKCLVLGHNTVTLYPFIHLGRETIWFTVSCLRTWYSDNVKPYMPGWRETM